MEGYIHSIESFGTVDGPGIRYVVFLQGCPMRCQYCHNPDTWEAEKGKKMSVEELLEEYESYRPFLKKGGLTVTGGEPLLQLDFLLDLFREAKKRNIHTCLDTSGIIYQEEKGGLVQKLDELMEVTDLVMLDIKHIDKEAHIKLTGHSNENILKFAKYLEKKQIPIWVRHVVVPEITLKEEPLRRLGSFLAGLSNLKALDVLPYHDMGKVKYERLGMDYVLSEVKPVEKEEAIWARNIILEAMRAARSHI